MYNDTLGLYTVFLFLLNKNNFKYDMYLFLKRTVDKYIIVQVHTYKRKYVYHGIWYDK